MPDNTRQRRLEDIHSAALKRDASERDEFLRQACGGDMELRRAVESLLGYEPKLDGFLEAPPWPGALPRLPEGLSGKVFSHYRAVQELGRGGMGVVYQAEDIKLGRRVAVKFLPEELARDPLALERFEREARAASALEHPNICPIYEFGEQDGHPFIVMPLLEGQTLRERIGAQGALPLGQMLDLALQIADGLDAAHQKGIIHRDIKPANIFITTRGEAKILDFGLAKVAQSLAQPVSTASEQSRPAPPDAMPTLADNTPLTRTGAAVGTAPYMSPEQVRGEKLDVRTDLFSFGAVLYEMATGRQAFPGATAALAADAILSGTPISARQFNRQLPPALEEVITKALEKDRDFRYRHAAELRTDLKRVERDAGPEPTGAAPAPRIRAGLALIVLAVLGSTVYYWANRRATPVPEPIERQFTANALESPVLSAAISPDGKYLVYLDPAGLFVRTIRTGETRPVSLPPGFHDLLDDICWFPDGGKLLATAQGKDGISRIWVITVVGEAPPSLFRQAALFPAISPDGRWVAFVDSSSVSGREIWIAGMKNEPGRKVVPIGDGVVSSPVWSPDGQWIAYRRSAPPAADTLEVQAVGGGPAQLVLSASSLPARARLSLREGLSWLPDWRLIFGAAQSLGVNHLPRTGSIWSLALKPAARKAGKPLRIFGAWTDFLPEKLSWTTDGRQLAFLKERAGTDVYFGELGKDNRSLTAPRRFTLVNRENFPDSWMRDSKSILFSSYRNGLRDGFAQTVVTSSSGIPLGVSTPDGAWILYEERAAAGRLMRVPAAGGPPALVLEWPLASKGHRVACPLRGRVSCVISQREADQLSFFSLDSIRGKGAPLGKIELHGPRVYWWWDVSPEGTRVAMPDPSHPEQIAVLTFSDKSWRRIAIEPGWGQLEDLGWTADGKGFFATSILADAQNLLHITLAGKVDLLFRQGHTQHLNRPLPSPDGRYLAFQTTTVDSNVWMLENF